MVEHALYPDFYYPESVRCYVRERVKTVTTVGSGIPTETDVTTEFTDEKLIAGRWHWDYPETSTTTGGVTTTVKVDVWEERRLAIQFDVSDQFAFGEVNYEGDDIISSSHMRFKTLRYRRTGFTEAIVNDDEVSVYGSFSNTAYPADSAAFDTLLGTATNSDAVSGGSSEEDVEIVNMDVLDFLPASTTATAMFLIDNQTSDSGLRLNEVKWAMNNQQLAASEDSGVDGETDWRKHWVRTALGEYRTKKKLPESDFEITLLGIDTASFKVDDPSYEWGLLDAPNINDVLVPLVHYRTADDWDLGEFELAGDADPATVQHGGVRSSADLPVSFFGGYRIFSKQRHICEAGSESGILLGQFDLNSESPFAFYNFEASPRDTYNFSIDNTLVGTAFPPDDDLDSIKPTWGAFVDRCRLVVRDDTIDVGNPSGNSEKEGTTALGHTSELIGIQNIDKYVYVKSGNAKPPRVRVGGLHNPEKSVNAKCPDGTCPIVSAYTHPVWDVELEVDSETIEFTESLAEGCHRTWTDGGLELNIIEYRRGGNRLLYPTPIPFPGTNAHTNGGDLQATYQARDLVIDGDPHLLAHTLEILIESNGIVITVSVTLSMQYTYGPTESDGTPLIDRYFYWAGLTHNIPYPFVNPTRLYDMLSGSSTSLTHETGVHVGVVSPSFSGLPNTGGADFELVVSLPPPPPTYNYEIRNESVRKAPTNLHSESSLFTWEKDYPFSVDWELPTETILGDDMDGPDSVQVIDSLEPKTAFGNTGVFLDAISRRTINKSDIQITIGPRA